jgi:hypothetical protein
MEPDAEVQPLIPEPVDNTESIAPPAEPEQVYVCVPQAAPEPAMCQCVELPQQVSIETLFNSITLVIIAFALATNVPAAEFLSIAISGALVCLGCRCSCVLLLLAVAVVAFNNYEAVLDWF